MAAPLVMANGFSATIPMTMDRYAERFREHGLRSWPSIMVGTDRATAGVGVRAQADWVV